MINIKDYIKIHQNFPKEGISFKDVSPILLNAEVFDQTIKLIASHAKGATKIVSPEARGFLFGPAVANLLSIPFVMARKPKKLPGERISIDFKLEYGFDTLEIQKDSILPGDKIVIIDDILATGGTALALCDLINNQQASVTSCVFIVELTSLHAREKFRKDINIISLVNYEI